MKRFVMPKVLAAGIVAACVTGQASAAGAAASAPAAAMAAAGPAYALGAAGLVVASAAAPPISAGARLAATCAACHGTAGATAGSSAGPGPLPSLAGQPRDALSASLRAFKSGTRPATIMTQIAKGYTDDQLDLLAAYFAAQKK
jgi:cytochrome c553